MGTDLVLKAETIKYLVSLLCMICRPYGGYSGIFIHT